MILKKLLFSLFLYSGFIFSQTTSTGVQVLQGDLSVNIETNETTTTLTITGPSNAWFAVGFDDSAFDMTSNTDVFRTDGTTIVDAQTVGNELPPADESQDWTLISNEVSSNVRTIVATRANDTGDNKDFVFDNSEGNIDLIWAFGATTNYGYHGGSNRGATSVGVTLNTKDFKELDFDIYPNPALNNVTIQLPIINKEATAILYDISGRKVITKSLSLENNAINIEDLVNGIYLLKVSTSNQLGVKRILKK